MEEEVRRELYHNVIFMSMLDPGVNDDGYAAVRCLA
jgi:hypothetical protein